MNVGVSFADITPPVGLPLSGFAVRRNRPSIAVDDPLQVKVLALEWQDELFLLVSYDLLGFDRNLHDTLRGRIGSCLGERGATARLLLVTTHTHSAPPTLPISGESPVPAGYIQQLGDATVRAVTDAIKSLETALLYYYHAEVKNATYNRRASLRHPHDTAGKSPGEWQEPKDNTLSLFMFKTPTGKVKASFVHFACHGVAMTTQNISGDVPGELSHRIGELTGAPCLYLQGASGDVNPITHMRDHAAMRQFVAEIIEKLPDIESHLVPVPAEPMRLAAGFIPLDFAPYPSRLEIQSKKDLIDRILAGERSAVELQPLINDFSGWRRVEDPVTEELIMHWAKVFGEINDRTLEAIDHPDQFPPVSMGGAVLRLGSFKFIFLAGEILYSVGEHIKALAPEEKIFVVSYLSPVVGYLADAEDYRIGGYEPTGAWMWYKHPGPFTPESEMKVLAEIKKLLKEIDQ
jgi:neutral ceramidase